jgi:signal transduction histidine kinase
MKLVRRLVLQNVVIIGLLIVILAIIESPIRPIALLVAVGALVISVIASFFFARSVVDPIVALRNMARAIANHDTPPRVELTRSDEIGELATTLNQLSTQLDALETTRRDFVANVSHELRTPLTIVGGFAETLIEDDVPPEVRQQFAEAILTNTRRMQRIVDDLLDLSRIESGGWVPKPIETDVRAVINETLSVLTSVADAKCVRLDATIHPDATRAMLDRTALRQILTNLVENAIRHTPSNGQVTIFTEPATDTPSDRSGVRDRAGIWIGVRDNGEGIPPEHLPRIFERFYRVDAGRSRNEGGTGLGLAIVRHLAEAHGGTAQVTSELGKGTTIRVWFPAG